MRHQFNYEGPDPRWRGTSECWRDESIIHLHGPHPGQLYYLRDGEEWSEPASRLIPEEVRTEVLRLRQKGL